MIDERTTAPSTTPSGETNRPRRSTRLRCHLLAAAGTIMAAGAVASCGADERSASDPLDSGSELALSESSEAADSEPSEVIREYRSAYNSRDLEGVMALFTVDSVVTGHPFATRSEGLAAIRSLQVRDIAASASVDAYEMSNMEVVGDTVTWNHKFTNADGDDWCAEGNSATVADGKILNWAFAPNPHRC